MQTLRGQGSQPNPFDLEKRSDASTFLVFDSAVPFGRPFEHENWMRAQAWCQSVA